jgi:hypothetical protein
MSSVFIMDRGPRFGDAPAAAPPEEDDSDSELSARERYKRRLSRQWMQSAAPRNWVELPVDPVTAITTPAAVNSRKGAGAVTNEEIEEFRARERQAFAERISRQWISNLLHL